MFFKKTDYRLEYSKLGLTYSTVKIRPYGERAGRITRVTEFDEVSSHKVSLNRKWEQGKVWKFYMYQKEPPSGVASLFKDPNVWDWHLESENESPEFRALFDPIVKNFDDGYFEFESTARDVSVTSEDLTYGGTKYVKHIFETLQMMSTF